MRTRIPLTLGQAAWLLAPVPLYLCMHIPLPGMDAQALSEFTHRHHTGLDWAFGVGPFLVFTVWLIGAARIVGRFRLPEAQAL